VLAAIVSIKKFINVKLNSMKTTSFNVRVLLTTVLTALLVFLFSISLVNAQTVTEKNNDKVAVEIKHAGYIDGQDVITLFFNNFKNEPVAISFIDDAGEVLHSDIYNGYIINKKFRIDIPDFENKKITLQIDFLKSKLVQTYSLQKSTKVIADITLAKL
jgi:hypothetical protein